MKSAKNLFGAFRRKVTLDVGDDQNQNAQQYHDLDNIVEEELDAATHFACGV